MNRFGPMFAAHIRRQRTSHIRGFRQWRWHLDEMAVKIIGETHYLWRAVDYEGEVLESFATRTRDKGAALTFMKKAMKRFGSPEAITTDGLRSYKAAMNELGNARNGTLAAWPTTGSRTVISRFEDRSDAERRLIDRDTFKQRRSAALAE